MEHRCYFGKTQSGKTTKAVADLKKESGYGKLFFNVIDNNAFEGFTQVDKKFNVQLLINLLANKRAVQYNADAKTFNKELLFLKDIALKTHNVIIAVDECHLLENDTIKSVREIWTGGRHKNVYGWAISQRPQLLDRTMLTQSKLIVFKLDFEDSYLKSYGLNTDLVPKENYKFIEI